MNNNEELLAMSPAGDTARATQISSRIQISPAEIGASVTIGIKDIYQPLEKWLVAPQKPEVTAMFWPCDITPQLVAIEAKPSTIITHYPTHMFITD